MPLITQLVSAAGLEALRAARAEALRTQAEAELAVARRERRRAARQQKLAQLAAALQRGEAGPLR